MRSPCSPRIPTATVTVLLFFTCIKKPCIDSIHSCNSTFQGLPPHLPRNWHGDTFAASFSPSPPLTHATPHDSKFSGHQSGITVVTGLQWPLLLTALQTCIHSSLSPPRCPLPGHPECDTLPLFPRNHVGTIALQSCHSVITPCLKVLSPSSKYAALHAVVTQ